MSIPSSNAMIIQPPGPNTIAWTFVAGFIWLICEIEEIEEIEQRPKKSYDPFHNHHLQRQAALSIFGFLLWFSISLIPLLYSYIYYYYHAHYYSSLATRKSTSNAITIHNQIKPLPSSSRPIIFIILLSMIIVITIIPATLLSLTTENLDDHTKHRKLYDRLEIINLSIFYYFTIYIFLLVKLWNVRNKIADYKLWFFQGFVGLLITVAHLSVYVIVNNYQSSITTSTPTSEMIVESIIEKRWMLIYGLLLLIPIWTVFAISLVYFSSCAGGCGRIYCCTAGSQQDLLSSGEEDEIRDDLETSTKIITSSSSLLPKTSKSQGQDHIKVTKVVPLSYGSFGYPSIIDENNKDINDNSNSKSNHETTRALPVATTSKPPPSSFSKLSSSLPFITIMTTTKNNPNLSNKEEEDKSDDESDGNRKGGQNNIDK
ncbi:9779_t:CDS:2 [Ambispora leptoticha]|uniref:9779_t:CDS:1 n=1 Tax=Ambispora leptoticha TaxID=144679 RepID=A0A9N8Z5M1_9GLOM|nr:9779_t:CDS:2 [Ambispora leptoticha]